MKTPMQEFKVNDIIIKNLKQKMESLPEIFSFDQEPLLASLISCLGFQYEIGNPQLDRLSTFFGVDTVTPYGNPWNFEIITHQNLIGFKINTLRNIKLKVRHPDLLNIIHPYSLNKNNELKQIIIFPGLVADYYKTRGLNLVVVKSWALTSFLAEEKNNYLKTNIIELQNNYAQIQVNMMKNQQIAFIGTHDLADHLLDGCSQLMFKNKNVFNNLNTLFKEVFNHKNKSNNSMLIVSYLIGVLLDDLAQPLHYQSKKHLYALSKCIQFFKRYKLCSNKPLRLDNSFNQVMFEVRNKSTLSEKRMDSRLNNFLLNLAV